MNDDNDSFLELIVVLLLWPIIATVALIVVVARSLKETVCNDTK